MSDKTLKSNRFFEDKDFENIYSGKHKPIIVAVGLRTPENLGSIIRLADNVDCQKVLFVDVADQFRESKIQKTAASSFRNVDWKICSEEDFINEIPEGYKLIAVETTQNATNIYQTDLPEKCAFVVGNEKNGLPDDILKTCQGSVFIPMIGKTKSMNVSQALTVAMFEWVRQKLFAE